jgi:hypothetical protein
MKLAIGTAMLVLLASSITYAQEQEKEKPPREEKKQEPAPKQHPQPQEQQKAQQQQQQHEQQHAQQQQQKNQAKQIEKQKSDAAEQQQQAARQQQQQQAARQQRASKQQQQQAERENQANAQHAQHDGGNRNSRRISEHDFHSHFGREHTFRVARREDRRFNYGGYYFVYNDPWPSDWDYADDVYVDEIDGEYYLIDPVHPGVRLLVIISD